MDKDPVLKQIVEKYKEWKACIELDSAKKLLWDSITQISDWATIHLVALLSVTELALENYQRPSWFPSLRRNIDELKDSNIKDIEKLIDPLQKMLLEAEKTEEELSDRYKNYAKDLKITWPVLIDWTKYYKFTNQVIEDYNI